MQKIRLKLDPRIDVREIISVPGEPRALRVLLLCAFAGMCACTSASEAPFAGEVDAVRFHIALDEAIHPAGEVIG